MDKLVTSLAIVITVAAAFVWGWFAGGRHSERVVISKMETTTTDTLWEVIHDTCWRVESAEVIRTDTVRLAYVPDFAVSGTFGETNGYENAVSGTYQDRYGHENGKSGTYRDTLILHDSVFVEVPIERKTFTGEDYRITAHGYRVGLDEVWVNRPTVYVTKTQTKTKRWAFSVGAQMGYGYTVHGGSPYVGLGVGFGYTF